MGFCVAITMNAGESGWVVPSSVTARSCMACTSAACVLGGVRLISSATRTSAKIGPLVSTNPLVWKLNRLVPRTSPGIRSGVNWIRLNPIPSAVAKARASSVLATPGTPSTSTCPSESSATSRRSRALSWPTTTLWISARSRSVTSRITVSSIRHLLSPPVNCLRGPDGLLLATDPPRGQLLYARLDRPERPAPAPRLRRLGEPRGILPRLARRAQPMGHPLLRGAEVGGGGVREVSPVAQQRRGRLDEREPPLLQRPLRRARAPEADEAAPRQQAGHEERREGRRREGEADQLARQRGLLLEAVQRLVDCDRQVPRPEPLEGAHQDRRVGA